MKNRYYNSKKLVISIAWVVTGLILLVASVIELIPSNMWSGMGGGLIAVGVMQLIRNVKYKSNETYRQKIDIESNDERNNYLRMKAWSWTGYIFVLGSGIVSIVLLIAGKENLSQIVGLCMCAQIAIYYIVYIVLSKRY